MKTFGNDLCLQGLILVEKRIKFPLLIIDKIWKEADLIKKHSLIDFIIDTFGVNLLVVFS